VWKGRKPPPRGSGGCAPKIFKEGASSQLLPPRHEWGPRRRQTLSPRGWTNGGPGGRSPHGGGLWGVSPHETKIRGEQPSLATRPRVGPKTQANPEPTRVGKGVEGAQPPPRGSGGCAPKIFKEGANSQLLPPRHEWDPKRRQTLSPRGWANGGPGGRSPRQRRKGVPPVT